MRCRQLMLLLVVVVSTALLFATPALAVVNPTPVAPRAGANTEMTFTNLGPGQGVTGFIAQASNPSIR